MIYRAGSGRLMARLFIWTAERINGRGKARLSRDHPQLRWAAG